MTHFGPTRAEMKFRLVFSVLALLMIVLAVSLRGLPVESTNLSLLLLVSIFLGGSAGVSFVRLSQFDQE